MFADNKQEAGLDNVYVPLRLIVTSDENVRNSIIKATNRQTEVKPDQLYALSDFQKKLEAYFETFTGDKRLYYERRSMQYADEDAEKVRIVSIQQQIRVFGSMFLSQAHKGHYGRALASSVGKGIFAKHHRLEPYYVSAYAYYKLESFFRRKALDAKYKPARYHLLFVARRLFENVRRNAALPAMHSSEMQRFSDEIMAILWDDAKALALFKESAKVLDQSLKGRVLERRLTKTEGFTADVEHALK